MRTNTWYPSNSIIVRARFSGLGKKIKGTRAGYHCATKKSPTSLISKRMVVGAPREGRRHPIYCLRSNVASVGG